MATIIYRFLPQYRMDFYDGLRFRLGEDGVELRLLYGKTTGNPKKDEVDLEWATIVRHAELKMFGKNLIFQHLPDSIYNSDLIILVQESSIMSNFTVAFNCKRRGIRLALWGHGRNFQDEPTSRSNWWKRQYSSKVDWWFAYTSEVAKVIAEMNFPKDRITVVNNAIDTRNLIVGLASVTEEQKGALRRELNIRNGPVGIYCGGMYPEKRLPFLFEACEMVKRSVPEFALILIGAGPDATLVRSFAATHDWVHYVGPKFGRERIPYFSLAQIFLMPGLVGLGVLDSFALQTPIVTTAYPFHSPEIEYVENGVNGLISDDDVSAYARTVIDAIRDPLVLASLRMNARASAMKYTVEAMVANFAEGVLRAMDLPAAG